MKNIKKILGIGILLSVSVTVMAQQEHGADCERYKNEALKSIASENLVYKRFGMPITLVSKEAQEYLFKKYNLTIRQMGCIIEIGEECYNKEINAYLMKRYGKSAHELIEEAEKKNKSKA